MKDFEVVFEAQFKLDVEAQVRWLEDEHPDWVPKLESGLLDAFSLLASFPLAGAGVRAPLRKLLLHKLPLVIWYVAEEENARVRLLRLFHARQKRLR